MREFVDAMTDEILAKRPTIEEVVEIFDSSRCSSSSVKLRSPITSIVSTCHNLTRTPLCYSTDANTYFVYGNYSLSTFNHHH
jgi:hypothetical protein